MPDGSDYLQCLYTCRAQLTVTMWSCPWIYFRFCNNKLIVNAAFHLESVCLFRNKCIFYGEMFTQCFNLFSVV